ncbi:hypothetical protein PoMZ_07185 [Pyricularia oryzae]|uniref:Uncharacterized protein n=1 Tax=Pyricularia oryzae TaxID=318829 RepID=A0A4P7NEH3_PYROR|nr:hypothetical protein PoMZ_07185 [Pyricularia oryzae]
MRRRFAAIAFPMPSRKGKARGRQASKSTDAIQFSHQAGQGKRFTGHPVNEKERAVELTSRFHQQQPTAAWNRLRMFAVPGDWEPVE